MRSTALHELVRRNYNGGVGASQEYVIRAAVAETRV